MNYKVIMAATVVGMAFAVSPARAQNAASADAESATGLAEIVVTAQRRTERLQDVPVTVSAVSANMLADNNILSAQQIGELVSGVVMTSGNTSVMPFIRGIGSSQRTAPAESSVATYIDGIYVQR
jgi:iron complex outermembrane recepter protein